MSTYHGQGSWLMDEVISPQARRQKRVPKEEMSACVAAFNAGMDAPDAPNPYDPQAQPYQHDWFNHGQTCERGNREMRGAAGETRR